MKTIESILYIIVLICLCAMTLASVFVWHNMFTTVLFLAGVLIWVWGITYEKKN